MKLACFLLTSSFIPMTMGPAGSATLQYGYYCTRCAISALWTAVSLYVVEVYPTTVRGTATATAVFAGKLASAGSPLVYEVAFDATGSHSCFFSVLGGMAFLNMFALYFLSLETYNAPLIGDIRNLDKAEYGATDVGHAEFGATERVLRIASAPQTLGQSRVRSNRRWTCRVWSN